MSLAASEDEEGQTLGSFESASTWKQRWKINQRGAAPTEENWKLSNKTFTERFVLIIKSSN